MTGERRRIRMPVFICSNLLALISLSLIGSDSLPCEKNASSKYREFFVLDSQPCSKGTVHRSGVKHTPTASRRNWFLNNSRRPLLAGLVIERVHPAGLQWLVLHIAGGIKMQCPDATRACHRRMLKTGCV
jgi:hypothetical protein